MLKRFRFFTSLPMLVVIDESLRREIYNGSTT